MNLSGPGITYLLMVIPTFFAVVVVGQGIYKITKGEQDGGVVLTFGIIFLALIAAAYFFFIK